MHIINEVPVFYVLVASQPYSVLVTEEIRYIFTEVSGSTVQWEGALT